MSLDADLQRLALQEETLQFERFDAIVAWDLGLRLKAHAEQRKGRIAIDIQLNSAPLFFYAMPGTTPDNVDWIRRKRNVVMRFHKSSYAVALSLQQRQVTLPERHGVSISDYVAAGGGFPIRLRGSSCVGCIAVSGLPQREDHNLIVATLADYLNITQENLLLDAE